MDSKGRNVIVCDNGTGVRIKKIESLPQIGKKWLHSLNCCMFLGWAQCGDIALIRDKQHRPSHKCRNCDDFFNQK